ncbi:MAG: hypothetical protein IT518_25535 [Burkholderiales bacterium]|nr:hypothetical protein [Burkholderiales bacterium]
MGTVRRAQVAVAAVLLGIFSVLFVYASYVPLPSSASRPLDRSRVIAAGEELARASVADPESARFRRSFVSTKWSVPTTCGEINHRNLTGGYTGFHRFVAAGPVALREDEMSAAQFKRLWSVMCEADE